MIRKFIKLFNGIWNPMIKYEYSDNYLWHEVDGENDNNNPEPGVPILVQLKNLKPHNVREASVTYIYKTSGRRFWIRNVDVTQNVIAWRYMPRPYKT